WGNAEGADLWSALSKASGNDVSRTATSFLDQGGMPIIEVNRNEGSSFELRQVRFYTLGVAPEGMRRWFTPVTLKYSDGNTIHTRTVMLSDTVRTIRLEDAPSVAWIYPNAEARGYYRWHVDRDARWMLTD